MYFHRTFVISGGVNLFVPKSCSTVSVHPSKAMLYPPKGIFLAKSNPLLLLFLKVEFCVRVGQYLVLGMYLYPI